MTMHADIAQIISEGWRNGKTSSEVAEEIVREFFVPSEPMRCLRCGTVDAFGPAHSRSPQENAHD